ncbi:radical SAM protein [uncultured Desulfovibrio sp.]|uniref:radical SAM/SPASM domain-containing protein n=1 Tax=uncultured Desulfovibrio sp. TaxID=167968 RepID=UPI00261B9D86|nr:radical SAM protein [uncultured Desulfovibrio sp.]
MCPARPAGDSPPADPLAQAARRRPGPLQRLREYCTGDRRPLQHIQVEVTSHCPGACIYCPRAIHAGTWRARHMADATFAALWPLMRRSRRVHLQGWGEPLLHPRFLDYVALARAAGCAVSSTTCGLRMNEALADGLVRSGMDVLAFSLTGTDAAANAARRNVPFERVAEAVACLHAARRRRRSATPRLHLAYLLLAGHEESARRLPELMREWDVAACVVSTLDLPVLPEHWHLAFAPHENEKIAAARALLEETSARAAREGRSIRYGLPQARPIHACREDIDRSCYIDADGAISPCIYVNVPCGRPPEDGSAPQVFGRVPADDPWEVWNRQAFADFRGDLAHDVPPRPCVRCPKRFETFV